MRPANIKLDIGICITIFFMFVAASFIVAGKINQSILTLPDAWFQADIGRVYKNMTDRHSNHYRTKVHPLFSISTAGPVHVLKKSGIDERSAVNAVVAVVSGLTMSLFYLLLRRLLIRPIDSVIFSLLLGCSSAWLFWTTVPETYVFGTATIVSVVYFLISAEKKKHSDWSFLGVTALSLTMTVTNWMAGIAACLAHHSIRKSIRITVDSFVIVTVLWAIQQAIFPSAQFFLFSPEERHYLIPKESGSFIDKFTVFVLHSMVTPEILNLSQNPEQGPRLSVQLSGIGSGGPLSVAASIAWVALLCAGAWSALQIKEFRKPVIVIFAITLGQLLLHSIYGEETFLYSLHWTPLLVIISALGSLTKFRIPILIIAASTVFAMTSNNASQFKDAALSFEAASMSMPGE